MPESLREVMREKIERMYTESERNTKCIHECIVYIVLKIPHVVAINYGRKINCVLFFRGLQHAKKIYFINITITNGFT